MALVLNYAPHPGQLAIHNARDRRFRTVCCGRRFGKTLLAAAELIDRGGGEAAGDYGWIAPTYFIAERGVEAVREIGGSFVRIYGQNPVRAEFRGEHGMVRILFLSADNPDSILGLGFRGILLDEAARIDPDTWHYTIRPTISQTNGWALMISTPRGRNWFYDLFTRGKDPEEKDYAAFSFPSKANPYFPEAEYEEARRTLPSDVFRQEYEAEFLEDSAGVFHNIEACLVDKAPQPNSDIAIGCDIAKHTDFTVLIAMDRTTGACVDMERFNRLDWPIQKERILAFCRKWRGLLVMDATGVGDPIYDDLARVWPRIEAVKFTNLVKTQLVQRLVVAVEQRTVSWPRAWGVLTDEMKRYEYAIGASGTITYSAPSGFHDDCVMALALVVSGRLAHGSFATIWPIQKRAPVLAISSSRRGLR